MSSSQNSPQAIQERFARAQQLQSQGDLEGAIAQYREILEADKTHLAALHQLAQIAESQGKFGEAIERYRKAISLDSNPPFWVYRHLGFALDREGQLDEAIVAYRKALGLNPEDVSTYALLGQVQAKVGDIDGAISSYQQQISRTTDVPIWVYLNLGDGLSQVDRVEEAIEAYTKALALEPENEGIRRLLENVGVRREMGVGDRIARAKQFQDDGKLEEALSEYRLALVEDEGSLMALHQMAQIFESQEKWNDAIERYRKALDIDAEPPSWVYRHLGFALTRRGDLERAVEAYRQAVELNPEDAEAKRLLEGLQGKKEDRKPEVGTAPDRATPPEQKQTLSPLSETSSSRWELYHQLGDRLQVEGKLEEAVSAYHKAIVRNSKYSWSYHNLGDTYLKLKQWDEAIAAYYRAIELNPNYFWSHYNLAQAYTQERQWDEAGAVFRTAIDLSSGLNLPYLGLRDTLQKQWTTNFDRANSLMSSEKQEDALQLYKQTIHTYTKSLPISCLTLPREAPEKPAILLIADDYLPQCLRYRVRQKIEQLEFAGFVVSYFPWREAQEAKNQLHFCDVVIFYRVPALPDVIEAIEYAKAIQKVVFYEIDDLVFDRSEYPDPIESYGGQVSVAEYHGLIRGTTLFWEAMSLCDYGIASTPLLVEEIEKVVAKRKCFLHRNALDRLNAEFVALKTPKIQRTYLSIFYGSGTKAHDSDFNDLAAPAIARILEKYPHVRLTLMGYVTLPDVLVPHQERIDRVALVKEVEIYWEFLRQADINIAVIHDTKFNSCKSELKWFEAASLGIPSVVSSTQTYREVIQHGVDGLLASNPDEWFNHLEQLVTDDKSRQKIAESAYQRVWSEYSVPAMANNIKQIVMAGVREALKEGRWVQQTNQKKLLIVNVFYPPQSIGGATRIVKDNVAVLQEQYGDEYEISVFTTNDDYPKPYQIEEYVHNGIRVTRVSSPMEEGMDWRYQNPQMYEIFSQYLNFNQPDLIHFHCIQRLTGSIVEAAGDLQIPYVVTVHDAWWISDRQFLVNDRGIECEVQQNDPLAIAKDSENIVESIRRRRYLKQRLEGAKAILAVSEAFAEIYRRNGFPQTKTNRNGIMPKPRLPRKPNPSQRVRLAHIGGISAHKGYDLMKEALERVGPKNLELIVVDHAQMSGTLRREQWGSLPVTFLPKTHQDKMHEFYSTIDVLMAPSLWPESFGLVTREAAAAGVWVVASNKGAMSEDLAPGVNGDVINPQRIVELMLVLQRIDEHPEEYQNPVEKKIHIRTTEEQVRELEETYRSILVKKEQ